MARFAELFRQKIVRLSARRSCSGGESPRHLYATDALAALLPTAFIQELKGQAHEAMTSAPKMYAEAMTRFLLS